VIDIALEVHQGGSLLKHTVVIAILHSLGNGLHVGMALADVHIVANADDVGHEADHVGSLADRLTVGDLTGLLVQVLHLEAKQVAGAGETETCSGGVVAEYRDSKATIKHFGGNVVLAQGTQNFRYLKHGCNFVVGLLPSMEKVIEIHVVCFEGLQLLDHLLNSGFVLHVVEPPLVLFIKKSRQGHYTMTRCRCLDLMLQFVARIL